MKTKTTIILLAVAGILAGFVEFYEKKLSSTRDLNERDQYVFAFDRGGIDGIVITSNDDRVELRLKDNRWDMVSPVADRADQNVVNELLTRCEMLRKEAIIDKGVDKPMIKSFGLSKAHLRLKFLGKLAPPELLFGKDTAVEGRTYVRLDGSNVIYVIGDELRNLVLRKPDDFREHRLTQYDAAHTTRFAVKTAAGEIQVTNTGGHWELQKPLRARADDLRVAEFVNAILGMQIAEFVPDKGANLNIFGLGEPAATLTFWTLAEEKPFILEIGTHTPKADHTYVRFPSRNAVYELSKRIDRLLTLVPNDLRDRHLARLDFDIVDRISIESAENPKLTLQRRMENWTRIADGTSQPVNLAKVRDLVKTIQTKEIAAFVADIASDLSKFGLDRPRMRVTFASYSSENTAETTAGEHPFLTVAFGKDDGKNVFAHVEAEPFVVSVDKSVLGEISGDPADWRELPVFRFKPDDIIALNVTHTATGASVSIVRSGTVWKQSAEMRDAGEVNSIHAQSLVNTLAGLKAVRWIPGDPNAALNRVTEIIAFTTTGGKSHKLLLGALSPDGTRPARLDGDTAAFAISGPDESALRLSLVEP